MQRGRKAKRQKRLEAVLARFGVEIEQPKARYKPPAEDHRRKLRDCEPIDDLRRATSKFSTL